MLHHNWAQVMADVKSSLTHFNMGTAEVVVMRDERLILHSLCPCLIVTLYFLHLYLCYFIVFLPPLIGRMC